MNLREALERRGYELRQHLEEEGWAWRKPTVVELDMVLTDALKHGSFAGVRQALQEQVYRPPGGLFTFPSLEIEAPLERNGGLTLGREGVCTAWLVAPRGDAGLWSWAKTFAAAIGARAALDLPVLDARSVTPELLTSQNLIVLGGSHENSLALQLALRHRTFFADATVPGDDGWLVTTHCGLSASGHNVLQIVAPPIHREAAAALILKAIVHRDRDVRVEPIHHVTPGKWMAAHFPSFEKFVASLPPRVAQLEGQTFESADDLEAASRLLARGLDSGGRAKNFYNISTVDITLDCARHYQCSADRRSLTLFRELLFRLADYYLRTPGGASYPADIDFRLGLLVLHYARLEHDPIFDDEDRLILSNLLLSCARSVHEYSTKHWPVSAGSKNRHNHMTFKALTLQYAADYFSRFGLACVRDWLAYSEAVFDCDAWRRTKMSENAWLYEPFVFEHSACHALFKGRGLEVFAQGVLEQVTSRQIAATDNFLRAVDYGDTSINLTPAESMLTTLLATRGDGLCRWFANESFARNRKFININFFEYPGIRLRGDSEPPAAGNWELQPMDAAFLQEYSKGFPQQFAFDKLAFRTGWREDDQYLLVEGVGGEVGHSHYEANGIVRLNHLGRHWVVSNGYGRRTGITDVSKSLMSRERGPEDHNMLVLRHGEQVVRELPMSAMLQHSRQGPLLLSTTALTNYGGVDWMRTLVVVANHYVLVLDRVLVNRPGITAGHVEWNLLGRPTDTASGCRLEQQGVFMDVSASSGWRPERTIADQSNCWKQALDSGAYPYASFPLTKIRLHLPDVTVGQCCHLATLLHAHRGLAPLQLTEPEPGRVVIEGPHPVAASGQVQDADLRVTLDGGRCGICFDPSPALPAALREWRRA